MSSPARAVKEGADARPAGLSPRLWLAIAAGLALLAYRALLPQPRYGLEQELEFWFFLPGDSAPWVAIALAGWLAWRRRATLSALPARTGSPIPGLLWLGAAAAAHLWATFVAMPHLLAISIAAAGLGLAQLAKGNAAVRALALPAVVALFALPLPAPLFNHVVWWLQLLSASASAQVLDLVGSEPGRSGDVLWVDGQLFSVVENCSGMRAIENLALIALVCSDLLRLPPLRTAMLLALAPLVALAVNVGRVAWVASLGPEAAEGGHTGQGIATLLVGCTVLYGIGVALEPRGARREPQAPSAVGPPTSGVGAAPFAITAALLAALAAAPLALGPPARADAAPTPPSRLATVLPEKLGPWSSHATRPDLAFLGSVGFRDWVQRTYTAGEREVEVFAAIEAEDASHSALSPKTLRPGSGWVVDGPIVPAQALFGGEAVRLRLRRGDVLLWVHHERIGAPGLWSASLRNGLGLDVATPRVPLRIVRLCTPLGDAGPAERARAEHRLGLFSGTFQAALRDALARS